MSIDPSSIPRPNFGPVPPAAIKPTQEVIKQVLTQLEINHFVDEEGDIGAPWEGFRVYFMLKGESSEIYTVRMFLDREFDVTDKPRILEVLDDWHRQYFWPKAYTHVDDNGRLRIIAETQLDLEPGINPELFVFTTRAWISTCISFSNWLAEQLPADDVEEA